MNTHRISVIVSLLTVVGLILAACSSEATPTTAPATKAPPTKAPATEAPEAEGTPYKIGFAPSVSGGGAFLGEPERDVAEIIAAQLEEAGGVVGSDGVRHPVEILIGDTESNPDVGVSVARRYVEEDEVVTLVMGSLTPISLAIAEVAEEAKVPYVSMASSLLIITDPDTGEMRPWVFKTPQSNGDVAVWQVERLTALGATSVCYLYENTGYGGDCFRNSSAALELAGFETAYEDSFERTDTEFPQLAGVQAAGCDAVVVGAIPPGASLVTIALRDALPDIPIIHGHGVCTEDFIATAGAAAEGMEMPCSEVIIAEDVPAGHPQKDAFMEFYTAYTDYTGEPVSTFGGHAWDGLMWVIEALESLPDGLTLEEQRVAVRDYIETNITDWPGTAGVFTIMPDDHYGLTYESFTWFKVVDGTWVPFPREEWGAPPASVEGTPYRIGFAPSVSGGGAFLGEPERDVAEIIAAQLEEAGGVVGSDGVRHPVEILIGDTESNPDVGVSVARRYVEEDEVVTLVMGSLTPISLAIAEVAEEAKVPYVSMASSLLIITDPDTGEMRPWVFKTPQSNGDVAVWQVERLTALGATSVCYLYENTGYGGDCFRNSSAALELAGFETAYEDSFERTDTEFPQLAGVQAAGCDAVVIGAIPPGASLATIALRDALPDIPIIHGHGVCTEDFVATAGAAAEGMEMPCSAVIIAEDIPAGHPQKDAFTEFYTAYTDYTGEPVSTFGGHAWDGLMWVIEALESLPDGLTLEEQRVAVRDYIETNVTDWPGTAGVFTITPDDHYGLTHESFTWFKVAGGTWVPFPREEW